MGSAVSLVKHLKASLFDNYPGDKTGEYERSQAGYHANLRGECFEKSKKCYSENDHDGAKKWSAEGKHHDHLVKQYNEKAESLIFKAHNDNRGIDEIDLHGLFVKEAIARVEDRIKECKRRNIKKFRIIVGKGLHSQGGMAKIKPAIMEMVSQYNLRCSVEPGNEGCLIVEFVKPSEAGFFGWAKNKCDVQ